MKEKDQKQLAIWFDKLMLSLNGAVTYGSTILNTKYGPLDVRFNVYSNGGVSAGGKFTKATVTATSWQTSPASINNIPVTGSGGMFTNGCDWVLYLNPTVKLKEAKQRITLMFEPEGLGVVPKSQKKAKAISRKRAFIEMVGDETKAMQFAAQLVADLGGKSIIPNKYVREVIAGNKPTEKYWAWVAQEWWMKEQGI